VLPIEEVGLLLQERYPDYNDITDLARLGKVALEESKERPELLDNLFEIERKYDPGLGRFTSAWRRKKSESKSRLLVQLIHERELNIRMVQQRYALQDLLSAQELLQVQRVAQIEAYNAQTALSIQQQEEAKTSVKLLHRAANENLSLPDFLELSKKRALDEAEMEADVKAAMLELQYGILSNQMDAHIKLDILTEKLIGFYRQVEIVKQESIPAELKARIVNNLEAVIKAYEKDQKDTQARLHKGENRQNPQGARPEKKSKGDIRIRLAKTTK
jgi:hypothetical protein